MDLDIEKGLPKKTAVALGNFDGVHLGHQKLIKRMVDKANEKGLAPAVLLFKEHTKSTINHKKPSMLTTNSQKFYNFEKLGVEIVFTISFSEDIMKLSEHEFIEKIIIEKMNSELVVVGYDYRFGYKAKGSANSLKEIGESKGIDTEIVDAILIDNEPISSTVIRNAIGENDLSKAEKLLGRSFSIMGKVIDGEKRGRTLGFPTANLKVDKTYILPKGGVYYTKTFYDGKCYKSITDIGNNPTFEADEIKIETHILDFKKDIYGEEIEIFFIKHMRNDIKFDNKEDLINQVNSDIEKVKNY